ncbi:hypothetical protein TruAng_001424 [Truncatella angustata]|nr:hypothetical protein TruAng_001424 [Truncatella angustata]
MSSTAATAPLHTRDHADGVPNSYIVALKPQLSASKIKTFYKSINANSLKSLAAGGYLGVTNTFNNVPYNGFHIECDDKTLESIRNNPLVDSVYQDGYVYAQRGLPSSMALQQREGEVVNKPWGLGRVSHRNASSPDYITEKPMRTYLYCLDTGVRISHNEFGGRAIWGKNFVDKSPDSDENGHGTHTCATAAGNSVGVDNTTVPIAVKCLDKNAAGTWSNVMSAVDWAVGDAQARRSITRSVVNMSIGGPAFQPMDDVVSKANAAGMTMVVAASNDNADASKYSPARSPGAITVAAIDRTDTRAPFSNYGGSIAIFAPGVDVHSAWLDNDIDYKIESGTSMAPHIAGLATYLISREGLAGPTEVKKRILKLATGGLVKDAKGSPNLIAFNGAEDSFIY